jgi:hypothetical protein
VGFAGLREVPVLRPKLHKEVKASSVGNHLAGRACVVAVPRLQGFGDRLAHPRRKWHQRHPVEAHGKAVALRDPLLQVDDKGWVPWLSPDQAVNPVLLAIECKPAPLIPEVGHIPEHEVAV